MSKGLWPYPVASRGPGDITGQLPDAPNTQPVYLNPQTHPTDEVCRVSFSDNSGPRITTPFVKNRSHAQDRWAAHRPLRRDEVMVYWININVSPGYDMCQCARRICLLNTSRPGLFVSFSQLSLLVVYVVAPARDQSPHKAVAQDLRLSSSLYVH